MKPSILRDIIKEKNKLQDIRIISINEVEEGNIYDIEYNYMKGMSGIFNTNYKSNTRVNIQEYHRYTRERKLKNLLEYVT